MPRSFNGSATTIVTTDSLLLAVEDCETGIAMTYLPRLFSLRVMFLCASLTVATVSFGATDQQVVDAQYPSFLLTKCVDRVPDAVITKFSSFARADLDGTGANYLVAAYSNGYCGAVRAIKVAGGVVTGIVDAPSALLFQGGQTTITARDLDGDGRAEVIATFNERNGADYWILKWRNGVLEPFQPTRKDRHGNISTILREPIIDDIDGDGIAEIAVLTPSGRYPYTVYYLRNGSWTTGTPAVFSAHCTRTTGDPDDLVFQFGADRLDDAYDLMISNGRANGDGAVTSAVVTLNGVVLFRQDDFTHAARVLTAPVHLKTENLLLVSLDGKPSTELTVTVRPSGPVQQ